MKKTALTIIASLLAAIAFSATAFAEGISIVRSFSGEDGITLFVSEKPDDVVEARIAGIVCDAEVLGDVSSKSDKFETLFLIDSSTSMKQYNNIISSFITGCIDVKRENENFSIAEFSSDGSPLYLCDFETDRYELSKVAEKIVFDQGKTYIYENLINVLRPLANNENDCYKRVVLFTDGNENGTTGSTLDDIILFEKEYPIQIHVVSLVNNKKSNTEALKNIEVLARSTGAATIRIDSEEAVPAAVETLMKDTQNIYGIKITTVQELLDGGKKTIELSFGGKKVIADIRMIMSDKAVATDIETAAPETSVDTTITTTAAETSVPSEDNNSPINLYIIIGIVLLCIVIIVATLIALFSRKKEVRPKPVNEKPTEDTATVKIRSGESSVASYSSGDTQKLFNNTHIILRDIANSDRTFEISVQGEIIIGRSSSATVIIDYDKSISGKHCCLFEKEKKVFVKDLQSSNKTFVNEKEVIVPVELHTSDTLKIGRTTFKITIC